MEKRIPFKNLNVQNWQNLALFALLGFYFGKIILELYANNLFNTIGSDYLAFWTVGHIANTHGYAYIYDLSLLARIQKPFHEIVVTDNVYVPIPAPFLSFFIVPFQLLAILNAKTGYAVWSILNLIGLIFYLRLFIRDLTSGQIQPRLMALLVISYPVFLNLFWGQINVWLAICVGEFMRASMKGKPFVSGLCLAGLLIKPQSLVLILPVLLLQRSWKKLAGFTTGTIVVLVISLGLAGLQGMHALLDLWLKYASAIPTSAPETMVNWRMVGIHLSSIMPPTIAWVVASMGLIATIIIAVFLLWQEKIIDSSPKFPIAFLGILAATLAATWDSHMNIMLIILPPLLYLVIQNKIPLSMVNYWSFGPPTALLLAFVFFAFSKSGLILIFNFEGLFLGLCGLAINLTLLAWSISAFRNNI